MLRSYNKGYGVWKQGLNTAECQWFRSPIPFPTGSRLGHAPHRSPDPNCSCGFYVLTDFDAVPFSAKPMVAQVNAQGVVLGSIPGPPMIVGAVVGWGRVVQHDEEGWRSEFAQVIALLDCKVSDEHLAITRAVAEVYGVPVVGRTALELLAKEYGDRLPYEKG